MKKHKMKFRIKINKTKKKNFKKGYKRKGKKDQKIHIQEQKDGIKLSEIARK